MTDLATAAPKSKWRKPVLQMLAGAGCGALGMIVGLRLIDGNGEALPSPDIALGMGVGIVYLLTSLLVILGTLAPRFGAQALNVEDADEIREQQGTLIGGGLIFLFSSALLFALTLAPAPLGAGLLGPDIALAAAAVAFLGLVATAYRFRNHGDEMMRQANLEAANLTMVLVFVVLGAWAMLSQLGRAEMFSPLLFVSGLFALHLLAVFLVIGRRGMLKPR